MKWIPLVVFLPTFVVMIRIVGFDRFDRRSSPGRVFICMLLALLVTGGVDWIARALGFNLK